MGGYFCGKEWNSESDDPSRVRRAYAMCWGKAVKDPKENASGSGGVHYVCYVKYRAKKYISIEAWGDTPAAKMLASVEKGDYVLCFGTFTRTFSKTKKGDQWTYSISADIVITAELILWLLRLFSSRRLRKMMEEEDAEAPDVWESD